MIDESILHKLFQNCQGQLEEYWQDDIFSIRLSQIFRGVTPDSWKSSRNCSRKMLVFKTYNIIPKYCFDCFKVTIEPRTVVELFKLLIIFERLDLPLPNDTRKNFLLLPDNNIRKCMVEPRPQIAGTYKGYIYCQNLNEAKEILNVTQAVISEEISQEVPVALKRGCSEFPLLYPEYAQFDNNNNPVMEYKDEWQKYEDLADKNKLGADLKPLPDTYDRPGFNLYDAKVMLTWVKYAATIGDPSCLKITDRPVPKFQNLKRPPFKPVD